MKRQRIPTVGEKFGRLSWQRDDGYTVYKCGVRLRRAWCSCDCGNEKSVLLSKLLSGYTQSCGCFALEVARDCNTVHGESNKNQTPEYTAWRNMITRCHDQNNKHYKNYGGRGISVCQEWRSSYVIFLADVGRRPSPTHSIDRIDNNAGYEKGNIRWATKAQQLANRRHTVVVTLDGIKKSLAELAIEFRIPPRRLRAIRTALRKSEYKSVVSFLKMVGVPHAQ